MTFNLEDFKKALEALNNSEITIEEIDASEDCYCEEPLIEQLINNQLEKHIEEGTFPSLEEAQVIVLLDNILSKYSNAPARA